MKEEYPMKKVLLIVVAILAAVEITNFVLAPQTLAGVMKEKYGMNAMKKEAVAAYKRGGEQAVKDLCGEPFKKADFFYTCAVINGEIAGSDGRFKTASVKIEAYTTEDAARAITTGLYAYEKGVKLDMSGAVPQYIVHLSPVEMQFVQVLYEPMQKGQQT